MNIDMITPTIAPVTSPGDLETARLIYTSSFTPEEMRPWPLIIAGDADGTPTLRGIYDGTRLIGMVTTWNLGLALYVEHLCIDSAARGGGIGSRVVRALIDSAGGLPLLLEVEPESLNDMAARRIGFYERNGLSVVCRDYVQPPYAPGLPPVELWLMSSAPVDTQAATGALYTQVYGVSQPR